MSKLAILGDVHIGCHSSSAIHHAFMKRFFTDFFKYIDDNDIKHVLQLGDLFDVRKHINTWSFSFFRQNFLEPAIARDLQVWVLVGNHDIYYRESLEVSSVEEVLMPYRDWFHVIGKPTDTTIAGHDFLLVPWVCKENHAEVTDAITASKSTYCAGHFEFNGFELYRGHMARSQHNHAEYKKFDKVFSGHYHHMSSRDNVLYTGTPYELTWQDSGCSRGFFVMDDDGVLTFEENRHKLYKQIDVSTDTSIDDLEIRECILKVKLSGAWEPKAREALLDKLYSMHPHSIKLIEPKTLTEDANVDASSYGTDVGLDNMINDYVTNISIPETIDRERLQSMLLDMMNSAAE